MLPTDTELRLMVWRDGSTRAEQLAASVLRIEGYQNIVPQAPTGGPDGRKDILCDRGGRRWLGAVYFPPTVQRFKAIKGKFLHDLEGVRQHRRDGIVFLTNQRLKPSERDKLTADALTFGSECDVFDIERICRVLDSADGYGVRVSFLRIPLSLDEQVSFFARQENTLADSLERNTAELERLATQIAMLHAAQRFTAQTMASVAEHIGLPALSPPRMVDPLAHGTVHAEQLVGAISATLSPELILLVHRLVGFELPARMIGRYRTEPVIVGWPSNPTAGALQTPASADVPTLIAALCDEWRRHYSTWRTAEAKLTAVARFHHSFLAIHPFLDANGRVARALLLQQCIDLFGRVDMSRFDRGAAYNRALLAANDGDLRPLADLIRPVIEG